MLQAVGQELIRRGHRMLFITCEMLVQELLIAKRDLKLSRLIKKYSRYEGMIIDDLGYIRQTLGGHPKAAIEGHLKTGHSEKPGH